MNKYIFIVLSIFSNYYCWNRVILEVLLNVCQHDHLAHAVATVPHATEVIIDLMQTFRDKSTIFYLATQIMIFFAQSNEKAKVKDTRFSISNIYFLFLFFCSIEIMQGTVVFQAIGWYLSYHRTQNTRRNTCTRCH